MIECAIVGIFTVAIGIIIYRHIKFLWKCMMIVKNTGRRRIIDMPDRQEIDEFLRMREEKKNENDDGIAYQEMYR